MVWRGWRHRAQDLLEGSDQLGPVPVIRSGHGRPRPPRTIGETKHFLRIPSKRASLGLVELSKLLGGPPPLAPADDVGRRGTRKDNGDKAVCFVPVAVELRGLEPLTSRVRF